MKEAASNIPGTRFKKGDFLKNLEGRKNGPSLGSMAGEKVEDGIVQMIWTDSNRWYDCGAFKDCYPRIFALVMDIVDKAKDYSQNGRFYHQLWSSFFRGNRFYLEVEVVIQCFVDFYNVFP
ncbi:hypothetical protein Gotur_034683 [Gossypium turneri]